MRRLIETLLIVTLAAGCLRAGEPQRDHALRFEPVKVVSTTPTTYPIASVASGTVILEAAVGKSGKIENIRVVHGILSLTEPAERSLQEWKLEPARIDGKPVEAALVTAFTFTRYGLNSSIWKAGEPGSQEKGQSLPIEPVKVISTTPAWYPVAGTVTGTVILKVSVDESGAIKNIEVMHGIASFTRVATSTVRQWKFAPAEYSGKPITSSMIASFVFAFSGTRR
ncbi:MAG: energy transducer TonB [Terriglobia bacterium]